MDFYETAPENMIHIAMVWRQESQYSDFPPHSVFTLSLVVRRWTQDGGRE